jgi:hypothetical protein
MLHSRKRFSLALHRAMHWVNAIHQPAPGRIRLGLGPNRGINIAGAYGLKYEAPLANLREYIVAKSLFCKGKGDFQGPRD